jgi:hypothetical protein
MKETQEILKKMGFENQNDNVWKSEWFGYLLLAEDATPETFGRFIYDRGIDRGITHEKKRLLTQKTG